MVTIIHEGIINALKMLLMPKAFKGLVQKLLLIIYSPPILHLKRN